MVQGESRQLGLSNLLVIYFLFFLSNYKFLDSILLLINRDQTPLRCQSILVDFKSIYYIFKIQWKLFYSDRIWNSLKLRGKQQAKHWPFCMLKIVGLSRSKRYTLCPIKSKSLSVIQFSYMWRAFELRDF